MSKKFLGDVFDIHGGGIDLIFPHHENEIAQSRCANDTKVFANYWIHNAFITMSNEKMAKSTGNIPVSYTHLRAHETLMNLVCRLLLEKKAI